MDESTFASLIDDVGGNLVTELSISFNDFVPQEELLEEFIEAIKKNDVLMKVDLSNLQQLPNFAGIWLVKTIISKYGLRDFSIRNSEPLSSEIVKMVVRKIAEDHCKISHLGLPGNFENEADWQYLIYYVGQSKCLAHLSVFNHVIEGELLGKFKQAFKKNGVTIIFNDVNTENLELAKSLKNKAFALLKKCYCAPLSLNWQEMWFKDPTTGKRPKYAPNLLSKKMFFPEKLMKEIKQRQAAINYLMHDSYNEDFDIVEEIELLKNPQNRLFHWILNSSHLIKLLIDGLNHKNQDENSLIIRRMYFKASHFILDGKYGEILRRKLYDFEEKFNIQFDSAKTSLIKALLRYDQDQLANFLIESCEKNIRFEYVRLRSDHVNSNEKSELLLMKDFENRYEIDPHALNDLDLNCTMVNPYEEFWSILAKEMMNTKELAKIMLISHSVIIEEFDALKKCLEIKKSQTLSL